MLIVDSLLIETWPFDVCRKAQKGLQYVRKRKHRKRFTRAMRETEKQTSSPSVTCNKKRKRFDGLFPFQEVKNSHTFLFTAKINMEQGT